MNAQVYLFAQCFSGATLNDNITHLRYVHTEVAPKTNVNSGVLHLYECIYTIQN